jgi:hypothetical protein
MSCKKQRDQRIVKLFEFMQRDCRKTTLRDDSHIYKLIFKKVNSNFHKEQILVGKKLKHKGP